MDTIGLDFETYYDSEYSLSKMTTEAYVRDPRFEMILVSVKINDAPAFWLLRDRFEHFIRYEVDWTKTACIAQHAHFDGLILNHHFGVRPALWIDTLSMARVIDGPKAGNSLDELLKRHSPTRRKGNYVTYAKGKHLADFSVAELHQYGQYSNDDNDGACELAALFIPQLPESELRLIDLIIRMFTEPMLIGDTARLRVAVDSERERKAGLLRRVGLICPACAGTGVVPTMVPDPTPRALPAQAPCKSCSGSGVDKKTIGSNEKLVEMFRALGVEPGMKASPANPETKIWAFAKTDPAMQDLLEHENEEVRFLAEARIAAKSTQLETRAQRYLHCAENGPMPVYIAYGAAHTLRMGGGDSMNWQNLAGVNAKRPEVVALIQSVGAPPGHKLVRADSGQGEARLVAWQSGQQDLVDAFAQKQDVYSMHASVIYGRPVDRKKVEADHIPGQLGKISILGKGYGMGWYKFAMEVLKGMLGAPPIQFKMADLETMQIDPSRFLANPKNIERINEMPSRLSLNDRLIHCAVAHGIVQKYRQRYRHIVAYWDLMETVIDAMIEGREMTFAAHGVLRTGKECIWLPQVGDGPQMKLNYRGLSRSDDGSASYFNGRERKYIYGGSLTENITQCLHRLIVCEQMLEIAEVIPVKLMRHDDVVGVVPEAAAQDAKAYFEQVMSKTPAWATGLPLVGEGKIGNTLLEVK